LDISHAFERLADPTLPGVERWYAFHYIDRYGSEHDRWRLQQELATRKLPLPAGGVRTRLYEPLKQEEPVLDESFSFLVQKDMELKVQFGETMVSYSIFKCNVRYGPTGEPYEVDAFGRRK
jgi:hypothetical protein